MMVTPQKTHEKIKEISGKYLSGKVPINITSIATELGINKDTIVEHIAILKTLDLVEFVDKTGEMIIMTESGRLANL